MMKLAVLSDIHGNVPALEAVVEDIERWGPDEIIVNGDVVNRGPLSLACVRLLTERLPGARLIKGNHEIFVLSCAEEAPAPADPAFELRRMSHWTGEQLGEAVHGLKAWHDHLDLTDLDGGTIHVTHGSRLGERSGITPETTDEELAEKIGEPRDLFVGSHTHRPLVRRYNGTLVVNTGSVGQPFDGDPRAAYGRFTFSRGQWEVEIARVAFDRAQALRDFHDSGFVDGAGPLARVVYRELNECRMLLGRWMARYSKAVKAGEVAVSEAVDRFLAEV